MSPRNPYFNPECECFVVLLLNTRRRVKGHQLLTIGTMDTSWFILAKFFRGGNYCQCLSHRPDAQSSFGENPHRSEADIKVTRRSIRAGQLMKIEVLDHVIVGNPSIHP